MGNGTLACCTRIIECKAGLRPNFPAVLLMIMLLLLLLLPVKKAAASMTAQDITASQAATSLPLRPLRLMPLHMLLLLPTPLLRSCVEPYRIRAMMDR